MIAHLRGILLHKKPTQLILDVGGVGYRAIISLQTFYALPEINETVSLSIHTHVRETEISLYGFSESGEQEVFRALIGVNKVGPKLAITILSGLPWNELATAVAEGDRDRLSAIPGIGKKTAERLVMELAGKFAVLDISGTADGAAPTASVGGPLNDAVEALLSLGYKKPEAEKAAKTAMQNQPGADLETTLKSALALLS